MRNWRSEWLSSTSQSTHIGHLEAIKYSNENTKHVLSFPRYIGRKSAFFPVLPTPVSFEGVFPVAYGTKFGVERLESTLKTAWSYFSISPNFAIFISFKIVPACYRRQTDGRTDGYASHSYVAHRHRRCATRYAREIK